MGEFVGCQFKATTTRYRWIKAHVGFAPKWGSSYICVGSITSGGFDSLTFQGSQILVPNAAEVYLIVLGTE